MNEVKKIILASGNAGKLKEFNTAFSDCNIILIPQPKTVEYEVEETGSTFVENAIIKARHASKLSGLSALADDSGLIVSALQGQPGVRSARYAGVDATDQDNLNLLLANMQNIDDPKAREAQFFCCLVLMRHHQDPDPIIAKGTWQGAINKTASGNSGFGYDPVFYLPSHQCTAAELTQATKQSISHRAQAIKLMSAQLNHLNL